MRRCAPPWGLVTAHVRHLVNSRSPRGTASCGAREETTADRVRCEDVARDVMLPHRSHQVAHSSCLCSISNKTVKEQFDILENTKQKIFVCSLTQSQMRRSIYISSVCPVQRWASQKCQWEPFFFPEITEVNWVQNCSYYIIVCYCSDNHCFPCHYSLFLSLRTLKWCFGVKLAANQRDRGSCSQLHLHSTAVTFGCNWWTDVHHSLSFILIWKLS